MRGLYFYYYYYSRGGGPETLRFKRYNRIKRVCTPLFATGRPAIIDIIGPGAILTVFFPFFFYFFFFFIIRLSRVLPHAGCAFGTAVFLADALRRNSQSVFSDLNFTLKAIVKIRIHTIRTRDFLFKMP